MEKIKILYVDDEERNIKSFKSAFRREFKIDTAISAEEGKKLLEQNEYHILLTDQRMPKVSGVEFLTEICDLYPDIMRILITAYSDIEAVISAINKGKIYKYINKPYDENELKQTFEEAYQVYQYRKNVSSDVKRYKETFDKSNDPIFLINTKGEFIDANNACLELFGVTRSELLQLPCSTFFKDKEEKRKFMRALQESESVEDFEVSIKAHSDNVDCLISLKKLRFEFDNTVAYHGSLKNITFLKEATNSIIKDIVEKSEEDRQKFAEILHESLAQKLSGIKFYMASLRERNGQDSNTREEVITTASAVLDRAIDELREVCIDLVPQSINLGLDKALEEICNRMEKNFDVDIQLDLDEVRIEVQGSSVMYRFIQELILIVIEEAKAKNLNIRLEQNNDIINVKVGLASEVNFEEKLTVLKKKIATYGGSMIHQYKELDSSHKIALSFPINQIATVVQ